MKNTILTIYILLVLISCKDNSSKEENIVKIDEKYKSHQDSVLKAKRDEDKKIHEELMNHNMKK